MAEILLDSDPGAVPINVVRAAEGETWAAAQPGDLRAWIANTGFEWKSGSLSLVPGENGELARVLYCLADDTDLWDWALLPEAVPHGVYAMADDLEAGDADLAALAWSLAAYRFDRFKEKPKDPAPRLVWPQSCDRDEVANTAAQIFLVRDLINTPASHMGPPDLAAAGAELAARFGAECTIIEGDALLAENYPAVHAVGRAHDRAPRLIDIRWGDATARKLTIVGKGVCFDSGGLDIKSAAGMKLMKKDMGGGAHALGLAGMVMGGNLPVRLRVLVPAVENSISGNAMRPGDVIETRKGLTIEIGNTDAEGRVILSDALAEAASENPEVMVDFATLTGAARVALGTDVPALFCNDDAFAAEILAASDEAGDPLWRMPLWPGYDKLVDGKVADINNAPEGGYGGAITAALFLQRFVGKDLPWAHVDLMAWNTSKRPGRPEGGEAQGLRTFYLALKRRFGG